jgi:hypothetical protein
MLRYEGEIAGQDSSHAVTAGLRMTWQAHRRQRRLWSRRGLIECLHNQYAVGGPCPALVA